MFVAWCLVPTSISSSAVLGTTSWNAENQASCRHPNYDRHQLVSGIYLSGYSQVRLVCYLRMK